MEDNFHLHQLLVLLTRSHKILEGASEEVEDRGSKSRHELAQVAPKAYEGRACLALERDLLFIQKHILLHTDAMWKIKAMDELRDVVIEARMWRLHSRKWQCIVSVKLILILDPRPCRRHCHNGSPHSRFL